LVSGWDRQVTAEIKDTKKSILFYFIRVEKRECGCGGVTTHSPTKGESRSNEGGGEKVVVK
jgi:hypothetical protein